jgi:cobalt/nickel transport protein
MKQNKLQKKILIFLLVLCILTPAGILLPMFFNANEAWGEWSATTVKELVGYVPAGLEKYSDIWKAPVADYTISKEDKSVVHQSGFYIVSGIFGATITYVVMLIISRFMIKDGE